MNKITKRISVVDATGKSHIVIEYTNMGEFKPINGPAAQTRGAVDYKLESGDELNQISNTEFRSVLSNARYTVV
jgi:hypothetical protein